GAKRPDAAAAAALAFGLAGTCCTDCRRAPDVVPLLLDGFDRGEIAVRVAHVPTDTHSRKFPPRKLCDCLGYGPVRALLFQQWTRGLFPGGIGTHHIVAISICIRPFRLLRQEPHLSRLSGNVDDSVRGHHDPELYHREEPGLV